jgi:hypothetical protein
LVWSGSTPPGTDGRAPGVAVGGERIDKAIESAQSVLGEHAGSAKLADYFREAGMNTE